MSRASLAQQSGVLFEDYSKLVYIAGIRLSSNWSQIILFDGIGNQVAYIESPGLQDLLKEDIAKHISSQIDSAKFQAKIPPRVKFKSICMCLADLPVDFDTIKKELIKIHPDAAIELTSCSETDTHVAAVSDQGGVQFILSKKSSCTLRDLDGSITGCGGWGHILGDEGSGFWISWKSLKILFESEDDYEPPPHRYSTNAVWSVARNHFNVVSLTELGVKLRDSFDPTETAKMCQLLAEKATEGDPLCVWLFRRAGMLTAKHLTALSHKIPSEVKDSPGGLPVVCVGSVWKSFPLLKDGFVKQLQLECTNYEVTLMTLLVPPATGAAYIAANKIGVDIPKDFNNNYDVFFHYTK